MLPVTVAVPPVALLPLAVVVPPLAIVVPPVVVRRAACRPASPCRQPWLIVMFLSPLRSISMVPVVGGVTHDPIKPRRRLEKARAASTIAVARRHHIHRLRLRHRRCSSLSSTLPPPSLSLPPPSPSPPPPPPPWRWKQWREQEKEQGRGAEGTCHQACAISGQPVVPPERRLLWRTAPTATKIHRPSPNCAAGCGRITSCRGVHRGGRGREHASEMNNIVNKMWSESSGDYLASRRPLQ